MARFQQLANRITLGLLPSALNVGAAMLIQVETSFPDLARSEQAISVSPMAAGRGALMLNILIAGPAGRERKAVPL